MIISLVEPEGMHRVCALPYKNCGQGKLNGFTSALETHVTLFVSVSLSLPLCLSPCLCLSLSQELTSYCTW